MVTEEMVDRADRMAYELGEVLTHLNAAFEYLECAEYASSDDASLLYEVIRNVENERQKALEVIDKSYEENNEALTREYYRSVI